MRRLDLSRGSFEVLVRVPEQQEAGDQARQTPSATGDGENPVHVPAHRSVGDRRVVVGDHHDRKVVEHRQQNDHDRGDRVEVEDDDRQRHEQQHPDRLGDAEGGVAGHPLEDAPRLLDRRGDDREARRGQHQVGGGAGGVGRAADRDADVGLLERRRVVDPVAGHADDVTLRLQRLDDPELVLGQNHRDAVGGLDPGGDVASPAGTVERSRPPRRYRCRDRACRRSGGRSPDGRR